MAVINGRGTWGVRALIPNVIPSDSNWTRPADWLALNAPTNSTEQFTGLLAITNDDSNYVTLGALSTGNYTVDWGDGNVTTHASGSIAYYKYDYSTISESTLSSRGYKQVVVKLTGTNITTLYTNRPHTALASATNVLYTWLEYHINLPNCASLVMNKTNVTNGAYQTWVEKVTLNKLGNVLSFNSQFNLFYSLQELVVNATTTSVVGANGMFNNCFYLKSVPLFDTSNVTDISSMFYQCYSLTTIPSFNFGSAISAGNTFYQCFPLASVPSLNLGNVSSLSQFFYQCQNLTTIDGLTTTKCTNFNNMFLGCISLKTVPLFDTSKATTIAGMFGTCYNLLEVPAFNTSLVTDFGNIFEGCYNLRTVPLMDTQRVTNFSYSFRQCLSLTKLPALNLNAMTSFGGIFNANTTITEAPFTNLKLTFSFVNLRLSRAAIVDIFNGLASGVTSKIITVSGNPGYASLTAADRLIATAKGWTIA